jgi:soluble lytic murein transglycosylase-like protein
MIRVLLAGAVAAATLSAPALADSPVEFFQKQAERTGKGPALKEGRSSFKSETKRSEAPRGGNLESLVQHYAAKHGVPRDLAHGVVMVESRYRVNATGKGGYIGLMQIGHRTAKGMGYSGSRQALYNPSTNLDYGMRYLGEAYRQAGGDYCRTVSKYQGGHGVRGVTKAGSVYCGKVKKYMVQNVPAWGAGTQVASLDGDRS